MEFGKIDSTGTARVTRLNVWDYEIDGHVLSLMANKGPLFENGNVFAWYGVHFRGSEGQVPEVAPATSEISNTRK